MTNPVKVTTLGERKDAMRRYGEGKSLLLRVKELADRTGVPYYRQYNADGSIMAETLRGVIDGIQLTGISLVKFEEGAEEQIKAVPFMVTLDLDGSGWMFFRSGNEKRYKSFVIDLYGGGSGALKDYYDDTTNNYLNLFCVSETDPSIGIIVYVTSSGWNVLKFRVTTPKPNWNPLVWSDTAYEEGDPERTKSYIVYDFEYKIEGPFKKEIKKSDCGSLTLPLIIPKTDSHTDEGGTVTWQSFVMPENTDYGFVFPRFCFCWLGKQDKSNPKIKLDRVQWEVWAEFFIEVQYEFWQYWSPAGWKDRNYFYQMGVFVRNGSTEWEGIDYAPIDIYGIEDIFWSGLYDFGLRPKSYFYGGENKWFQNLVQAWPIFAKRYTLDDRLLLYRQSYYVGYPEYAIYETYCLCSVKTKERWFVRDYLRCGVYLTVESWQEVYG